jgi:hypothetical protein
MKKKQPTARQLQMRELYDRLGSVNAVARHLGVTAPTARKSLRGTGTAVAPTGAGGTTWGKETRAQKQQEYNRLMGVTVDLVSDVARSDAEQAAAYISGLASEEEKYVNRRLARSVSLSMARENLFVRRFEQSLQHVPAFKPVGCAVRATRRKGAKRIVNLLLSDLHVGANLDGAEGPEFSWRQECARLSTIVAETRDYKPQHRANTHLNILFMGDLIEGMLEHDARDGDTLTEQFTACMYYVIQIVGLLSAVYPTVSVHWQTGNHGRNKLRHVGRATSSKWDSFETMIGVAAQAGCADLKNVDWHIPKTQHCEIQLFDSWLFATHGDTLLNVGNPGKSLDVSRIEKQIDAINASNLYGHRFGVFAVGHVHVGLHVALPSADLIINPALVPPNGYARSVGYHGEACGQWLWESVEGHPVGDARLIKVPSPDAPELIQWVPFE